MISAYIQAAMRKAHYELLPDDKLYYGEIPELIGVYATGQQLEDCRHELQAVLEDWLLLSLRKNLPIPVIDNISLEVKHVA
ncbi:MAG: type II toxin-antitoxin system HicB family antitoxin [Bacteroidota bacterium]|nr:type II toxin-antitoxin system HicB family antitoxin [Flavisolibacter sp.]MBD0295691.1 type II toxin-antitoxin system HicB family antitoxin [Flavisolibacter sp.]MBD0351922.1 type II toxin-antitoxin system HicB family antitoxin [Flavisolibacter sp.]MBD0366509.1 type II toxin-antitoxin system HicB family antitoxin [Flavisolibacter sp.]MDQ3845715.1 type II toxin-antitoxin system HicB family antitoxin [Bacteroidota bacterium]